jgi:hypothetical protein
MTLPPRRDGNVIPGRAKHEPGISQTFSTTSKFRIAAVRRPE